MKIDLHLQANFWRNSPSILIKLDNKIIKNITNFVDKQRTTVPFDAELDDGEHQLIIERQNKTTKDTLLKNSKIIKDSTINILDIVIDEISIEPLLDHAILMCRFDHVNSNNAP